MTGQKIDDLLHKRHRHYAPLGRLIHDSDRHQAWTDAVCSLLPDSLAAEVQVINFRGETLVLQASNASFATRLRYLLPDLTTKLRGLADFQALEGIRISVNQAPPPKPPPTNPRQLSVTSAGVLASYARSLQGTPKYGGLREAFLRLSKQSGIFSNKRDEDQP